MTADLEIRESFDSLDKIDLKLKQLDLTPLVSIQQKIKEFVKGANPVNAPLYIRDFIVAYDACNMLLSKATRLDLDTKAQLEMCESIAYLERAGQYLKDHEIKDSSEARKKYIDLDPDVVKAKMIKAKSESMVHFLANKLNELRMCHDSIKKVAYNDSGDVNFTSR